MIRTILAATAIAFVTTLAHAVDPTPYPDAYYGGFGWYAITVTQEICPAALQNPRAGRSRVIIGHHIKPSGESSYGCGFRYSDGTVSVRRVEIGPRELPFNWSFRNFVRIK